MKYETTAYLTTGPAVSTITARGFFEAIRKCRERVMAEQVGIPGREAVWDIKIVARKIEGQAS